MKCYSYFIPGYTGFCPQLKDHFGQSYGEATRHIIHEKPVLKDRLADIYYYGPRSDRRKTGPGKYCDRKPRYEVPDSASDRLDFDECDSVRLKRHKDYDDNSDGNVKFGVLYYEIADTGNHMDHQKEYGDDNDDEGSRRTTSRQVYEASDRNGRVKQQREYKDNAPCQRKCQRDYKDGTSSQRVKHEYGDPKRVKYHVQLDDSDRVRKADHERVCPTYVYVERGFGGGNVERSYAGCLPPEAWARERLSFFPNQQSYSVSPCERLKCEFPSVGTKKKGASGEKGSNRKKESHRDPKVSKVTRIKPHRQGGVVPDYMGHITGMQFAFGEGFGPAANRLLRKHHDTMQCRSKLIY